MIFVDTGAWYASAVTSDPESFRCGCILGAQSLAADYE